MITLRYAVRSERGEVVRTGTLQGVAAIDLTADANQDRGDAEAQSEPLARVLEQLEREVGAAVAASTKAD